MFKFIPIAILSLIVAGVVTAQRTEVNQSKSTWNWIQSDDGKKIEVRVEIDDSNL